MTDTFDMPGDRCPVCGYRFEAATSILGDGPPEPNNVTLCIKCAAVLEWDYAMRLRQLTRQELKALSIEVLQCVSRAQRLLFTLKAERN